MKKTLTLLAIAVVVQATAQVTNGGFEDWNNQIIYENPNDWENGNWIDGINAVTTTKVGSAPSGMYAVHLETELFQDDTLFGYVLQGEFENDDPIEGIPWTTEIQTIEGHARYDVQAGDTAILVFVGWSAGNIVGEDLITFVGAQSSWVPFSHPLNMGTITPDSILIAAASSNAVNEIGISLGSWLELDAIKLTSPNEPNPDMIPNFDFENWSNVVVEDPDDWSTYNSLVAGLGITSVFKSTDANNGSFSARIETAVWEGDTLPGILTNGELDYDGPSSGIPFVAQPAQFSGAYKYMPSGQDTANIGVVFSNNGVIIGGSFIQVGQLTSAWTSFNEIVFLPNQPDTMLLLIFSGENGGSILYVDDLDLTGGTVGIQELSATDIVLFPNPTTDQVTILSSSDLGSSDITLFDLSGRIVIQRSAMLNTRSGYDIDLSELPSGTYLLELIKDGERFIDRILKE